MTSPSFNLLDESFIPCLRLDGTRDEVSLRGALASARQIAEIVSPSPLVTIGLHRVLLGYLHAALQGPGSEREWARLWTSGDWPQDKLDDYAAKWQDRFDLFHDRFPFFQRAGFTEGKKVGANKLACEITETNVRLMFSHVSDDAPPILSFAEVARQLIAHQLTTGAGGRGYGSSPLSRGLVVLARGDTLFETLHLNLIRYRVPDNDPVATTPADKPVWEANEYASEPETPRGLLDLYTWLPRSILLLPDEDTSTVQWIHYGPRRMFRSDATIYDPAVAFYEGGDDQVRAVGLEEDKALWRDSGALLEFGAESRHRRPPWIEQLARVTREIPEVSQYRSRIGVLGAVFENASVKIWRAETLDLPDEYIHDPTRVASLKQALGVTEEVLGKALMGAVRRTAELRLTGDQGGRPDKKRVKQLVDSFAPERLYWSRLEGPYRELLVELATAADRPARIRAWFLDTLRPAAVAAFDDTIGRIDSGRDLKAVTAGRGVLYGLLKRLEPAAETLVPEPQGVAT